MVELFLKNGADVNLPNADGLMPLMVARKEDMASLLLENGAKLDQLDDTGMSPLLHMVERKCYEAIDFMLRKGADPELCNDQGKSAASILKERYHQLVSNTYPECSGCIQLKLEGASAQGL